MTTMHLLGLNLRKFLRSMGGCVIGLHYSSLPESRPLPCPHCGQRIFPCPWLWKWLCSLFFYSSDNVSVLSLGLKRTQSGFSGKQMERRERFTGRNWLRWLQGPSSLKSAGQAGRLEIRVRADVAALVWNPQGRPAAWKCRQDSHTTVLKQKSSPSRKP